MLQLGAIIKLIYRLSEPGAVEEDAVYSEADNRYLGRLSELCLPCRERTLYKTAGYIAQCQTSI